MGWFDGGSDVGSTSSHHHKSHSSSGRKHSSGNSIFGGSEHHKSGEHHHSNHSAQNLARSLFGTPSEHKSGEHHRSAEHHKSGEHHHSSHSAQSTARSIFGFGGSSRSKRSPRRGYMAKMYAQLRRLLRDLIHYMKQNPLKVFMLVIMPLITGGVLTGLLARFGIRLPAGIERMLAKLSGKESSYGSTSIGRGRNGELQFERKSYEGPLGAVGNIAASMGGAGNLISVAKMFM